MVPTRANALLGHAVLLSAFGESPSFLFAILLCFEYRPSTEANKQFLHLYSGTTDAYCALGCLSDYGTCGGTSLTDSWRTAQKYGIADQVQGGQYYYDTNGRIFWTWDTPALMERKFAEIVDKLKIGGVMAWSLGLDSHDWSHVEVLKTQVGLRA